jgi:hypothetical protein
MPGAWTSLRSLLLKAHSNLSLLLQRHRETNRLPATGVSSDIARARCEKGLMSCALLLVREAQKLLLRYEPWILI